MSARIQALLAAQLDPAKDHANACEAYVLLMQVLHRQCSRPDSRQALEVVGRDLVTSFYGSSNQIWRHWSNERHLRHLEAYWNSLSADDIERIKPIINFTSIDADSQGSPNQLAYFALCGSYMS